MEPETTEEMIPETEYRMPDAQAIRDIEGSLPNEAGEQEAAIERAAGGLSASLGQGKGDARYHSYTGRGPKARHESEIYQERGYSQEEGERRFQETVVRKIRESYDTRIGQKRDETVRNQEEANRLKEGHEDEYEHLNRAHEELERITRDIEQSRDESNASRARAAYLGREYEVLYQQYQQDAKSMDELIKEGETYFAKNDKIFDKIRKEEAVIAAIEECQKNGERVFFPERRKQRCRNKVEKYILTLNENARKKISIDDQVAEKSRNLAKLNGRMGEIRRQTIDLAQQARTGEENAEQLEQSKEALLATEDGRNLNAEWFAAVKKYEKDNRLLEDEMKELERGKADAESQVLLADVVAVPTQDYESEIKGIYIDGQMYLDEEAGEETYLRGVDQGEAAVLSEEQKIVQALRQREIFQYVNSDNLMEYLTYDEGKGDFQIPQATAADISKEELASQILQIKENLKQMGIVTNIDEILQPILNGDAVDMDKISAEIFKEAQRIEETGKYLASDNPEKMGILSPLAACRPMLVFGGIASGFWNISKFLGGIGLDAGLDFVGGERFGRARAARRNGDHSLTDSQAAILSGMLSLVSALSMGTEFLVKSSLIDLGLTSFHDSVWGEWSPSIFGLKLDILGDSGMTVLGAAAAGINIGKGLVDSELARQDKNQMRDAAASRRELGQSGYARFLETAAVEKAVAQFEGYVDAAKGTLSVIFALTGVGGLLATGIALVAGIAAKKIAGAVRRSAQKNKVLDSPEVLGGIDYNKNLISDKDFENILANVTGINNKDSLYSAIKITDSINIHGAMRRSLVDPDPDVDAALSGLGFSDKSKYRDIRLKDLQKKIGYSGDWRQDLRHAVEIKGVDYDTNWTRFTKGMLGKEHYADSRKRLSRQEAAARRQEKKRGKLAAV